MVLPLILFTGLMVGLQTFGIELLQNNDLDAEGFEAIEDEHEELEEEWSDQAADQSTWREEEGILERAVGATLVPRIASDILDVSTTMNSILDDVSETHWIPGWTATMLRALISAAVFFSLAGAYLRFRS